jgi:hypothetical protein
MKQSGDKGAVGWAKPPLRSKSEVGRVPTTSQINDEMVGTALRAFAHPTAPPVCQNGSATPVLISFSTTLLRT